MILVKQYELQIKQFIHEGNDTHRVTGSHPVSYRSLNNSIAILLHSFTRVINKEIAKDYFLIKIQKY